MAENDNASKWGPIIITAIKMVYDIIRDLIGRKKRQKEDNAQ